MPPNERNNGSRSDGYYEEDTACQGRMIDDCYDMSIMPLRPLKYFEARVHETTAFKRYNTRPLYI